MNKFTFAITCILVLSGINATAQVKSKVQSHGRTTNQLEAYGRVAYLGLNYYPIGRDSLEVKNDRNRADSVSIPATLTIDNRLYVVSNLAESAFERDTDLKYISIPSSITEISSSCFWGCARLTECDMPSVTAIQGYAFFRTGFTNLKVPEGVQIIGDRAFSECDNLRSVELPGSLQYIGDHAFLNENLDTVRVNFREPIPLGTNVFWIYKPNRQRRRITLSVPTGCKEVFSNAEGWRLFQTIVEH